MSSRSGIISHNVSRFSCWLGCLEDDLGRHAQQPGGVVPSALFGIGRGHWLLGAGGKSLEPHDAGGPMRLSFLAFAFGLVTLAVVVFRFLRVLLHGEQLD